MIETVHRTAARAAIINPTGEILLMRVEDPASGRNVWFTPGGGMEPGEPPEATVRRELLEETGLASPEIGPLIWTRRHDFDWNGKRIHQSESYFLVRAEAFLPTMSEVDSSEWQQFREFRWWSPDAIESSDAIFAPRRLPHLLRQLAAHGPPAEPVDVGI